MPEDELKFNNESEEGVTLPEEQVPAVENQGILEEKEADNLKVDDFNKEEKIEISRLQDEEKLFELKNTLKNVEAGENEGFRPYAERLISILVAWGEDPESEMFKLKREQIANYNKEDLFREVSKTQEWMEMIAFRTREKIVAKGWKNILPWNMLSVFKDNERLRKSALLLEQCQDLSFELGQKLDPPKRMEIMNEVHQKFQSTIDATKEFDGR